MVLPTNSGKTRIASELPGAQLRTPDGDDGKGLQERRPKGTARCCGWATGRMGKMNEHGGQFMCCFLVFGKNWLGVLKLATQFGDGSREIKGTPHSLHFLVPCPQGLCLMPCDWI